MIMQVSTVRTVDASIEFKIIEIEYIIIPHESGAENQMSSGAEILRESKGRKRVHKRKEKRDVSLDVGHRMRYREKSTVFNQSNHSLKV